jgi:predicted nucleic acid-binding protein
LIVLDASLMIARLLKEAHPKAADDIYAILDAEEIIVPSHWCVEIANALWTNIRRGRIADQDLDTIVGLLGRMQVVIGPPVSADQIGELLSFARANALTAYDAAYVQIARDHGARLATVDRDMRAAAERYGIAVLPS